MSKSYTAIHQNWYEHEYEPGWGASDRPDGFSLHVSKEEHDKYVSGQEVLNKDQSSSGYHYSVHPSGKSSLVILTEEQHTKLAGAGTIRVAKWDEKDWVFPEL